MTAGNDTDRTHSARIEHALETALALARGTPGEGPDGLGKALRYAVFPGGARVRPRLCLAVARACGDRAPRVADAVAASIELMHCASLVHDDLPCFDDASTRRGRPALHRAFGEQLAILTGDALIVLALQSLAIGCRRSPLRLSGLLQLVARGVGSPLGIVAGQAWECETRISLSPYQRAKTGALFAASTMAGALAGGGHAQQWEAFGTRLGEAYQVADDLKDRYGNPEEMGKPAGRDAALRRPNAVAELGPAAAIARLRELVAEALESIPACPGAAELAATTRDQATRLLPARLSACAA